MVCENILACVWQPQGVAMETIGKSFGLEAATQGFPDGNKQCTKTFTDNGGAVMAVFH